MESPRSRSRLRFQMPDITSQKRKATGKQPQTTTGHSKRKSKSVEPKKDTDELFYWVAKLRFYMFKADQVTYRTWFVYENCLEEGDGVKKRLGRFETEQVAENFRNLKIKEFVKAMKEQYKVNKIGNNTYRNLRPPKSRKRRLASKESGT